MIVGIDPGESGGIALCHNGTLLRCFATPTRTAANGKTVIDGRRLRDEFSKLPVGCHLVIENVSPMYGQGLTSTFQFGRVLGGAEAIASLFFDNARTHYTHPAKWKADMGLVVKGEKPSAKEKKAKAVEMATYLFGSEHWPKGPKGGDTKFDGLAEAALLAYYGWKYLNLA